MITWYINIIYYMTYLRLNTWPCFIYFNSAVRLYIWSLSRAPCIGGSCFPCFSPFFAEAVMHGAWLLLLFILSRARFRIGIFDYRSYIWRIEGKIFGQVLFIYFRTELLHNLHGVSVVPRVSGARASLVLLPLLPRLWCAGRGCYSYSLQEEVVA